MKRSLVARLLSRAPEEKASRTGPLIALQAQGRAVWTPRDMAALAREGFMKNAIVYRAVMMVADAAASVPLLLYDGDVEVTAHPLLDLLARPNPHQSGEIFRQALIAQLLVAGNAYAERVDVEGRAVELHALRPDRVRIVPGADGWPEAYLYGVAGRELRLAVVPGEPSPILHLKLHHPLDDHYGFAPLEAAASALDIHNAASQWNKALLDNAARPSGALVYRGEAGGNLSADQFERLKRELEQNYSGAQNAGRPLLLEGELDWTSMAMTPRDMDFMEAKHGAAREIALAFGVPPMLLGIPGDNTFANYQEANRAFWRQTVLPLVGRVAAQLAAWLPQDEGLRLGYDADAIEALSAEREALWRRVEAAGFLSRDEKRQAVGYGAAGE